MVSSFVLEIITNMTDATARLTEVLRERLALIADEDSREDAPRHTERLRQVSEEITKLAAALPPPVDPRLEHYLTRCSYSKALDFLEGAAPPRSRRLSESAPND
jgi:hypothetical protein